MYIYVQPEYGIGVVTSLSAGYIRLSYQFEYLVTESSCLHMIHMFICTLMIRKFRQLALYPPLYVCNYTYTVIIILFFDSIIIYMYWYICMHLQNVKYHKLQAYRYILLQL